MKKYEKIGLGIILLISIIFIGYYFISYKIDTKTHETDQSIEEILEKNKESLDTEVSKSKSMEPKYIYEMIHEMANTLIVAEDGLIYGNITINDENINRAMAIINQSDSIKEDEKLVFMNILQDWKEEDFSNGVQAHNYAWNKLNGTIGRAKDLKKEYK
jgi:hypothetical protein